MHIYQPAEDHFGIMVLLVLVFLVIFEPILDSRLELVQNGRGFHHDRRCREKPPTRDIYVLFLGLYRCLLLFRKYSISNCLNL